MGIDVLLPPSSGSYTMKNGLQWRDCAFMSIFCNGNDFKRNSSQLRKKYLQKQPVNLFGDVEDPNRQIRPDAQETVKYHISEDIYLLKKKIKTHCVAKESILTGLNYTLKLV